MKRHLWTGLMAIVLVVIPVVSFGESTETIAADSIYKLGMTATKIEYIENGLLEAGYLDDSHVDTFYGYETREAVKTFQLVHGLGSDGVVGPNTLAKLSELSLIELEERVVTTVTSRGSRISSEQQYGEYVSWYEVYKMFTKQESTVLIEDFYTGVTFEIMLTYGHNHFDVEPLTAQDAATIKMLWGGDYSWARRPVLVHTGDRVLAASLNGMPHAGLDNYGAGDYVSSRSAGYGYGYNYDFVKDNDFDGHICLHFKDSRLHVNDKVDWKHQEAVKIAAGLN